MSEGYAESDDNDPESYAGGSLSFQWGFPSQTGRRFSLIPVWLGWPYWKLKLPPA